MVLLRLFSVRKTGNACYHVTGFISHNIILNSAL